MGPKVVQLEFLTIDGELVIQVIHASEPIGEPLRAGLDVNCNSAQVLGYEKKTKKLNNRYFDTLCLVALAHDQTSLLREIGLESSGGWVKVEDLLQLASYRSYRAAVTDKAKLNQLFNEITNHFRGWFYWRFSF